MHKTGATRYQKFQKAEKAKTKLKGRKDKELPKGTNITKTNFKVKKIVVKEQLKKHGQSEALSTRKLNIKELLSRLNHFNTNSRTDALDGLKELITTYPEVLDQNLGHLIHGVTSLILNIEKVVRQGALQVLHLILSNVRSEKIEPFFDIMSTYLRSAMTHIDSRIQEDSLLFLDILLLCAPLRIAKDFHKIAPNFLDMISKLKVDSKPDRTLTTNLSSQNTSAKWRVKVFQRLREFLQKYTIFKKIDNIENNSLKNYTLFDVNKSNHYSLFNPVYISNCAVSCFTGKGSDNELQIDEIEKFKKYSETLVSLVFETWLEACPSSTKSDTNFEMVINEETGMLLNHLLQTLTLLKSLLQYFNLKCLSSHVEDLFLQKYKFSFSKHFMTAFPYVMNTRSRQGNKIDTTSGKITDPKLTAENLELCKLFVEFNHKLSLKNQSREINVVLGYIEKIIIHNTDNRINVIVINLLNTLFSNEITGWTRTVSVLEALFRKIIWCYFNKEISDTFKQDLFALLCKIALNEKLSHFHSNDTFDMWLKSLPDILLNEKLTVETVDIIHKFAVTNNKLFNSVLKPKLLAIIKNFPNVRITGADCDARGYHKLLSIFYWIKVWDTESLNLLESQLIENVYEPDHIKYIFDTLRLRSGGIL